MYDEEATVKWRQTIYWKAPIGFLACHFRVGPLSPAENAAIENVLIRALLGSNSPCAADLAVWPCCAIIVTSTISTGDGRVARWWNQSLTKELRLRWRLTRVWRMIVVCSPHPTIQHLDRWTLYRVSNNQGWPLTRSFISANTLPKIEELNMLRELTDWTALAVQLSPLIQAFCFIVCNY